MKATKYQTVRQIFCRRLLPIALIAPAWLQAQTGSWIAPGPYGAGSTYDSTLGYWIYDYAPPASWHDTANWDTGLVPNGSSATAIMSGYSNGLYGILPPVTSYPGATSVVLDSGSVALAELRFRTGSGPTEIIPQVTIGTETSPAALTLTGAGITWQIGLTGNYLGEPTIFVRNGLLEFDHQAGAIGTISAYPPDGRIVFRDEATAGTAKISGAYIDFYGKSTAGQARLTSYGDITFHDHATFGNATFGHSYGSRATFKDFSSAGTMQVTHEYAAPPWPDPPRIAFQDHATAANAIIDVSDLSFSGQSTAAFATIKVTGGDVNESHGFHVAYTSRLLFSDQSTADQAVITNSTYGTTTFQDDSSAGQALITNSGTLVFADRAALGGAHLECATGQMLTGNIVQVETYGFHYVPQYAHSGRVTFKDQASGGDGSITITQPEAVIDLSGLRAAVAGSAGRALLPGTPTGSAITPDDAGSISFGSIFDTTSGGTIYLGGTRLQLGAANHDMTLNARIADVGGAFGSLAGEPLQGGGLDKTGTGTLTIANSANSYRGPTAILQGRLNLDHGRISSTTIATGAWLTGNGTVAGNLTNSGVLSPGNSPGAITVQGNFVQNSTGVLNVEIASPASFDQLTVTGTATLGGTLNLSASTGFVPVGNTAFNFLNANAVTGRFDQVALTGTLLQGLGVALPWQVVYSTTGASFKITQESFAGFGQSSLAVTALGAHLDATLASSSGEYRNLIAGLNTLATPAQVEAALEALTPDRYSVLTENSFASAAFLQADLDRRFAAWRSAPTQGMNLFFEAGSRAAVYPAAGSSTEASSRLGRGTAGGTWSANGFSVGAAIGYEVGNSHLDVIGSSADLKSLVPEVFVQYASDRLFLNAAVARSGDDYTMHRHIVYTGNDQTARASTSGTRLDFAVTAGYTVSADSWAFTPEAGLLSSNFRVDDFVETGAAGANLSISDWQNRSLRSRIGFESTRRGARFTPRISVLWLHEFEAHRSFVAQFADASGNSYAVPGRPAEIDVVQAALSVEAQLGKAVNGYASLGGAWGRNSRITPDFSAGISWHF
jgi:autotransporter-associated beta strand protein